MTKEGFISYYPLKQGLKHLDDYVFTIWGFSIYILLSIKTRIETLDNRLLCTAKSRFISYYPLKQGLKPPLMMLATSYLL